MHTFLWQKNEALTACTECERQIPIGDMVWYDDDALQVYCTKCGDKIVDEYDLA